MTIVVDASAVVAALVDSGVDGRWAESVLQAGDLVAPDLLLVEATSVLRRLELAGVITPAEANGAFRDLLRLDVEWFPFEPLSERVWQLRSSVTGYDAFYVALAEALSAPLATLDQRLTRAGGARARFLTPPR